VYTVEVLQNAHKAADEAPHRVCCIVLLQSPDTVMSASNRSVTSEKSSRSDHQAVSPSDVSFHSLAVEAPQCHLPASPGPPAVPQQVEAKNGLADDTLLVKGQHGGQHTTSSQLGATHALQTGR